VERRAGDVPRQAFPHRRRVLRAEARAPAADSPPSTPTSGTIWR
jgi:hypothetical protein